MRRCWVALVVVATLGAVGALAQTFLPVPVNSAATPRLDVDREEDGPLFAAAAVAITGPPPPPGTPSLWYDGSDIDGDGSSNSAYTDGDPITTWVDKGSLGVDVTQASAAKKPTYRAGGSLLSGEDYLDFDGSDNLQSAAVTAFIAQPDFAIAVAHSDSVASQQVIFSALVSPGVAVYLFVSRWTLYAGSSNVFSASTVGANNEWELLEASMDGASSYLTVSASATATGNAGTLVLDGISIGSSSAGASALSGGIATIVHYETVPVVADVRTWATDKYGSFPQGP